MLCQDSNSFRNELLGRCAFLTGFAVRRRDLVVYLVAASLSEHRR